MRIDVEDLGVDMMTTSGHKFHGPNGTGFLYIRRGTLIEPLIHGGSQENGLRAGTENVPGIIGLAKAAEISHRNLSSDINRMQKLRNYFIDEALRIDGVTLNGSFLNRLCNNISITIDGVPAEAMLTMLDMGGISASSGSACNSSDNHPSHVLTAIGLDEKRAGSTVRFTLSDETTQSEIEYAVEKLRRSVDDIRSIYGK